MIKIFSAWTNPGGSTVAYIDLCNLFNKHGMDCMFFGTGDYPQDKCNYKQIKNWNDLFLKNDDFLIIHHLHPPIKFGVKKIIFSCHEKHSFPVAVNIGTPFWEIIDSFHFITDEQRRWHSVFPEESFVIGNYINLGFTLENKRPTGCAGVIGTIENRKRTFESVKKAISDGYKKVLLYGTGPDANYLDDIYRAFGDKVEHRGYVQNKKEIYSSIDKVYHLSRWEIACLVQGECKILGIPFEGSEFCPDYPIWTEDQIINAWKEQLQ